MKEVHFVSRRNVEQTIEHEFPDRRCLISISTPPPQQTSPQLDLKTWKHVLCLKFHDIDMKTQAHHVLFSDDQAEQVLQFIKIHEGRDYCIVHCDAGVSRSAAVAKFIAQIYCLKFPEGYANHNRQVFSTLLRIYGECQSGYGNIKPNNLPGLPSEEPLV